MPRKKAADQDKLLNRSIFIRMSEKDHQSLGKVCVESNCRSVSEAASKILFKDRITHEPVNGVMEELAAIQRSRKKVCISHKSIQQKPAD